MSIRKILEKSKPSASVDESYIEMLVQKGAPVNADKKPPKGKYQLFSLRIPRQLLTHIDDMVNQRLGMSRNTWILEAIQEKIRRDSREQ